eukprot:15362154-Ditylum_brightwellii.AAC.1
MVLHSSMQYEEASNQVCLFVWQHQATLAVKQPQRPLVFCNGILQYEEASCHVYLFVWQHQAAFVGALNIILYFLFVPILCFVEKLKKLESVGLCHYEFLCFGEKREKKIKE